MPVDVNTLTGPLREQVVESFISALRSALSEMAGIELTVRNVHQTHDPAIENEILAIVELFPTPHRFLILACPEATAAMLATRLLSGVERSGADGLGRDCIGELANVVAGQAKTALAATPFRFTCSLPKVIEGSTRSLVTDLGRDAAYIVVECIADGCSLRLMLTL
jgi:chemotaxis protein CheX